jgi:hypothetical protein
MFSAFLRMTLFGAWREAPEVRRGLAAMAATAAEVLQVGLEDAVAQGRALYGGIPTEVAESPDLVVSTGVTETLAYRVSGARMGPQGRRVPGSLVLSLKQEGTDHEAF